MSNNRETTLKKLRDLPKSEASRLSEIIQTRAIQFLQEKTLSRVALFRPIQNEVKLSLIEAHFMKTGVSLFYPRIKDPKQKTMEMREVLDPLTHAWTKSSLGMEEPSLDAPLGELSHFDAIFVPGVCFDLTGNRVGRGQGYYDRYLSQNGNAMRIALCYDFQLYEKLVPEAWDQSMHWVITESREIFR